MSSARSDTPDVVTSPASGLQSEYYPLSPDDVSDIAFDFIQSICKRLESFLPIVTGYSLSEVELNPQFVSARDILVNNSNINDANYVSYCFVCLCHVLHGLKRDNNLRINEKDQKAHNSILIILKVLTEIIKTTWDSKQSFSNLQSENFSINFEVLTNYSFYYYFDKPTPLMEKSIWFLIETFIDLLSPQVIKKAAALIKRPLINSKTSFNDSDASLILDSASSIASREEDIKYTISEIDQHIEVCLRFVATANPEEYYAFLHEKLFRFVKTNDAFPLYSFQKYSPLIKFVFYTMKNGWGMAEDILASLVNLKNPSWKQIVLVFYSTSIRDQCFARPEDYRQIVGQHPQLDEICRNIFDNTSSTFDDLQSAGVSSMIQSWIVLLNPTDFAEFETRPNKLRMTFNKRLKFLNGLIKDSNNRSNFNSFDSLINFYHVASRFTESMHSHPVYIFAINHLDQTYDNLCKVNVSSLSPTLATGFSNLMVNFFIAAIMLKPETYTNKLVRKFYDTKGILKDRMVIKIIRGLSESKMTSDVFMAIMKTISADLKLQIFNAVKILNQYPVDTASGSSSSISIRSGSESSRKLSFDNDLSPIDSKATPVIYEQSAETFFAENNATRTTAHTNSVSLVSGGTATASNSSTLYSGAPPSLKVIQSIEETLTDLLSIFCPVAGLYFNDFSFMNEEVFYKNEAATRQRIIKFCENSTSALKTGFIFRSTNENSHLFDATCELVAKIVDRNCAIASKFNSVTACANYLTCNEIIKGLCDTCLTLSFTDPKLKSVFFFLVGFVKKIEQFNDLIKGNDIIHSRETHKNEWLVCKSIERVLLLSLCTHDIQFYNVAKFLMRWHVANVASDQHYDTCHEDNLSPTFEKILSDETVFTGFVSLHKRIRNILREAPPTYALYQVWTIIYERWLVLLSSKTNINEDNLLFRHFTGFLVSTSGAFLQEEFSKKDPSLKYKAETSVSEFLDKCISLLTSQDLVVRVIIKDALSNESHSDVYQLITIKLANVISKYEESKQITDENILFVEQVVMILSSMVTVANGGSVILTALLADICLLFVKIVNLVDDPANALRLRLRYCKLAIAIESNRQRLCLAGAYKLRNQYAKTTCEWLEHAVFYDEMNSKAPKGAISSTDLAYLNIDLATESSKALSMQLEELVLEIPDSTSENDIVKYKDLAFVNYFSLFYKILTKYTIGGNSSTVKSKHKVGLVVENVLKCITNLLQFDADISMQFVFPLGNHDNKKIRSLFLSVFADMLYERKKAAGNDEASLLLINALPEMYDLCGAAAEVASSNTHNLLASSLFVCYSYVKSLDKIFDVLLREEINMVSRTSDIFRRNSTLTKLLSKLSKDYGMDYLNTVLKDFVEQFGERPIVFEVEKSDQNVDLFMELLNSLVDRIVNSIDIIPRAFKFICSEIFKLVTEKVKDAGLIAVGSFIFLRFFCPAIISPESFFEMNIIDHKNKRSLLQVVKVIQNMANGSLGLLKWQSLSQRMDDLNAVNAKIFKFLQQVSTYDLNDYPFEPIAELPVAETRYLHKFFFNYYPEVKKKYLIDSNIGPQYIDERIEKLMRFDQILKELRHPKNLLSMQMTTPYKIFDPTGNLPIEYTEFMNKMSGKYSNEVTDTPIIHNSIFADGTPVVVVNVAMLREIEFDVHLMMYKLFETASQVWDNKFYFVFDFTEFTNEMHLLATYAKLLNSYAPSQLFKNCARIYYFNIPRGDVTAYFGIIRSAKVPDKDARAQVYTYSHFDSLEIISSLCLSESTMAITRDKKVEFTNCRVLDSKTQTFYPATLGIGRQFMLVCSDEFVPTNFDSCATKGFKPVEIYRICDIVRCETTKASGASDEFTIYFQHDESVIIRSNERAEILRFLYFVTSRLPKHFVDDEEKEFRGSSISSLWFGRLFNIVFQGLLCEDEDVKSSASLLFASVTNYFDIEFSISKNHAKEIAYPANTTDFLVSVSEYLSKTFPEMSYRFFRAFFDSYDKVPAEHKMNAIMYVTPWIGNICEFIFLENEQNGPDRVTGIIRQFCLISSVNKEAISLINDYVWKKLFSETILSPILIDEVVNYAMDNRNDKPDWAFIITVVYPSVEVCGEVINRLITCINEANHQDSEIASESKLFEIMILVKICASLFFDSYIFAQLYLSDVFFICTLFIDNPALEFGADLQKLVINTIQSFLHKPDLSEQEEAIIEDTLTYFSSPRARMLFGLTRDRTTIASDSTQFFNRASSFEVLCDYLNEFITGIGSVEDRANWRARWCSYAIDIAFSSTSVFQVRAILLVGILSKFNVNDRIASKLIKLMSKYSFNSTFEYMTNSLISASKIVSGLSKDSVIPAVLIWPQLCFGLLSYASLYQPTVHCLLNTMIKNLEQGEGYLQRMLEKRVLLESFLKTFEDAHEFHVTEYNFNAYVTFIFCQGLKLSHIKHTSVHCLQKAFESFLKYDNSMASEVPEAAIPYLYHICMCLSRASLLEYFVKIGYEPSKFITINKLEIPSVLIDFLLSGTANSSLCLLQSSFFFESDSIDMSYKHRVLSVYNHIMEKDKEVGLKFYHVIQKELRNIIINSNSAEMVQIASQIELKAITEEGYSIKKAEEEADKLLRAFDLMKMKNHQFRKLSEKLDADTSANIKKDAERIQEMVYRSASSYVISQRLED